MSKRFTDTEKWKDPWFRKLSPMQKNIWFYLLDNCDNAGIWKIDMDLLSFCVGEKIDDLDFLDGRIKKVDKEKIWITKFINFQYGELNPNSRPHQHVIGLLKSQRVWIEYIKGIDTPQDKDKDNISSTRFIKPSIEEIEKYANEIDYKLDANIFFNSYESKNWHVGKNKMKNWKAAVRNWKHNNWGFKNKSFEDTLPFITGEREQWEDG